MYIHQRQCAYTCICMLSSLVFGILVAISFALIFPQTEFIKPQMLYIALCCF